MIDNIYDARQAMREHSLRLAHIIRDNTWVLIGNSGHPYPFADHDVSGKCAAVMVATGMVVLLDTGRVRQEHENDIYHLAEKVPVSLGGALEDSI